jgi:sulfite exporter TauE/SafE
MLPVDQNNSAKASQILTYHLGRLAAYSTIGLFFFGLVGKGLYMAGFQQQISVLLVLL